MAGEPIVRFDLGLNHRLICSGEHEICGLLESHLEKSLDAIAYGLRAHVRTVVSATTTLTGFLLHYYLYIPCSELISVAGGILLETDLELDIGVKIYARAIALNLADEIELRRELSYLSVDEKANSLKNRLENYARFYRRWIPDQEEFDLIPTAKLEELQSKTAGGAAVLSDEPVLVVWKKPFFPLSTYTVKKELSLSAAVHRTLLELKLDPEGPLEI